MDVILMGVILMGVILMQRIRYGPDVDRKVEAGIAQDTTLLT